MHVPVLQKQVIEYLNPKTNENFIDCTIGNGGHALAILEKTKPDGKILGIDWDSEIIKQLALRERMVLVNDSYANLKNIIEKEKFGPVSGILFDLGMSSWHIDESGKGFSFMRDEPLDMRYSSQFPISNFQFSNLTAKKIVNEWKEEEIEKILKEYGGERFARRIAKEIVRERKTKPIKTTFQLKDVIRKAVPGKFQHGRLHYATRTFQALRIAVNDELNNLKKGLPQAVDILTRGGRLVVISFHSLEDRIVKNFFKEKTKGNIIKILTKKPIGPTEEEIKINPRSRSAKLRAAAII